MIIATGLYKSYKGANNSSSTDVLKGADLTCAAGELVALVGPSGAGKSTLLHILASVDTADRGSIVFHLDKQFTTTGMPPNQLAKFRNQHIGMIFQFHHLLPEFTAVENVMMPNLIAGMDSSTARKNAMELLERVGLHDRAKHSPAELSGGEQQRVAIVRAIANKPSFLFADEPTGNLDSENATAVLELITQLQREYALTCIVATHSEHLMDSADRIVHMTDGLCHD